MFLGKKSYDFATKYREIMGTSVKVSTYREFWQEEKKKCSGEKNVNTFDHDLNFSRSRKVCKEQALFNTQWDKIYFDIASIYYYLV